MQLRPEQLAAHLDKPLAPLYVAYGNEPLLVIEAADAIRRAAEKQGFEEREVLVVGSGFRWDDLFLAAGNMSLFGSSKLIDLRMPSGKPGRDGGDALQRYCEHLAQGTVTLITLHETDWQTYKAAWFATLTKVAATIECNAPPLLQLPAWIASRMQRQRQAAPQDALQLIASHVEGNLLAAHQEIQKLALLYPEGQLTLAQVEAAIFDVARFDVDKLRQSFLAGDIARCARLLDGLRAEDSAPPFVLWALASSARALVLVRSAIDNGRSVDVALKQAKMFGPWPDLVRTAAKRVPLNISRATLLHAARIDRMIKGLTQGDVWDEMLQLAQRIAQRSAAISPNPSSPA